MATATIETMGTLSLRRRTVLAACRAAAAANGGVLTPADVAALAGANEWYEGPTLGHARALHLAGHLPEFADVLEWCREYRRKFGRLAFPDLLAIADGRGVSRAAFLASVEQYTASGQLAIDRDRCCKIQKPKTPKNKGGNA